MIENVKRISIRGRLAYCTLILENAFIKHNISGPSKEIILSKIWEFCNSNRLDVWEEEINDYTPIVLLSDYSNLNDYSNINLIVKHLLEFYLSTSKEIIEIIDNTIEVGVSNIYGATGEYSRYSLEPTMKVIELAVSFSIILPPLNVFILNCSYSINNGWGKQFSRDEVMKWLDYH